MAEATRSRRRPGPALGLAAIGLVAVVGGAAVGIGALGRDEAVVPPRFVDETATAGIDVTYDGDLAFAVGGGIAVFDCDEDGRPDLYIPGGEGAGGLFRNDSSVGGELRFTRVPSEAGALTAVNGAYPIDIDGDRRIDLVTLRQGDNVVLRAMGDCAFEPASAAWQIDGGDAPTQAFSATWEPGAPLPTLAFGNYVDLEDFNLDTRCRPNVLLRPDPAASPAEPAYSPPLELTPSYCALSMLFSDWSGTGRADLRISNDRAYYRQSTGQEQLWRLVPGERPRLYDAADGWARVQVEGMGIASHDLTGDGRPEVYLTSQAASRLQTLVEGAEGPAYMDIGLPRGVNVAHPFTGPDTHLPSTAWHPEFADVNNDGQIDLFVSKGNVRDQPEFAMADPSNLLLGQPDGTFVEAADRSGILTFDRGRGAALVDLNLDGRLDLVESFYGAPARVWRNAGPVHGNAASRWAAVRLEQPGNRFAVGAVVEVRAGGDVQRREVVVGGGHGGGQLGWIHFGVGGAAAAEIRVRWPGGEVGAWLPLPLDAFSTVERGASAVTPWGPPAS